MRKAQKISVPQQAWQLGGGSQKEREMLAAGKIRLRPDGEYALFSQESTGKDGEIARQGDYFKVDSQGFPYPNSKAFFEARHRRLEGDWYLQKAVPVQIWTADEPPNDAVRFLLDSGEMALRPDDPAHYFSAFLCGAQQTAARDAVVVFHVIDRDGENRIAHISFAFVAKDQFDKTYQLLPD